MPKKKRQLSPNDHEVTDWDKSPGKRKKPTASFTYELNGQRFTLNAPAHVVDIAQTVYQRITE